jgi:transposase
MRCSFEGLSARARRVIEQDPLSGRHRFVFLNRQRDYIKVLCWDDGGYYIWSKRPECGTIELPASDAAHVEIDTNRLLLMIEGISLQSVRKRSRFMLKN